MIPIRIHPFFWILALGLGWLNSGTLVGTSLWAIVIFISILVHEFGHALTAKFFGQRPRITLMAFGGVTSRTGKTLSAFKEFLVVLNGPLAGIALYFVCAFLLTIPLFANQPAISYALTAGTYVNLFWTLLNLLPVQPLDGGQLLLITSKAFFGPRGANVALFLSILIAAAAALFFILIGSLIGGAIFMLFAFESYRYFKQSKFKTSHDDNPQLKKQLQEAIYLMKEGQKEESKTLLISIREQTESGVFFLNATYALAQVEREEGNFSQAFNVLYPLKKQLDLEQLLFLQKVAFESQHFKEAIEVGASVHEEEPFAEVALLNAYSHAQLKETIPAVGWLKTAMREGLENVTLVLQSPYFDPIRDTDQFRSLEL